MNVIVTLTITGDKETMLEGYASFCDADVLEQKGIGFWLDSWKCAGEKRPHKSRCFCPWTSVLMMETKDEVQKQICQTPQPRFGQAVSAQQNG